MTHPDPETKARELLVSTAGVDMSFVYSHETEPALVSPGTYRVVRVETVRLDPLTPLPAWLMAEAEQEPLLAYDVPERVILA